MEAVVPHDSLTNRREKAFTAGSATGLAQISLDTNVGFTSIEILTGAYEAGQFEHGAYANADGSFGH